MQRGTATNTRIYVCTITVFEGWFGDMVTWTMILNLPSNVPIQNVMDPFPWASTDSDTTWHMILRLRLRRLHSYRARVAHVWPRQSISCCNMQRGESVICPHVYVCTVSRQNSGDIEKQ